MRVFLDTSVLVDAERKRVAALDLLEALGKGDDDAGISIVTVIEVLMGAHLRRNADEALLDAKEALGQFEWVDLDGRVAERAAELLAYLHVHGKPVGFQDCAIAASAIEYGCDLLVTENVEHFTRFPPLKDRVATSQDGLKRLRRKGSRAK